jgi:hypothetical protein
MYINSEHWSASIKVSGAGFTSNGDEISPIILSIYTVDKILDKMYLIRNIGVPR